MVSTYFLGNFRGDDSVRPDRNRLLISQTERIPGLVTEHGKEIGTMKQKLIERKLYRHTGTEGPRHDPYGYEEFEMEEIYEGLNGIEKTEKEAHLGLAVYFKIDDKDVSLEEFETSLGVSLKVWCAAILKSLEPPNKCPDCNSKLVSGSGYVGEELLYCPNGHGIFWSEEVTLSMIE